MFSPFGSEDPLITKLNCVLNIPHIFLSETPGNLGNPKLGWGSVSPTKHLNKSLIIMHGIIKPLELRLLFSFVLTISVMQMASSQQFVILKSLLGSETATIAFPTVWAICLNCITAKVEVEELKPHFFGIIHLWSIICGHQMSDTSVSQWYGLKPIHWSPTTCISGLGFSYHQTEFWVSCCCLFKESKMVSIVTMQCGSKILLLHIFIAVTINLLVKQ